MSHFHFLISGLFLFISTTLLPGDERRTDPVPNRPRLALKEDWRSGKIDSANWYLLRKKWGAGNHGVVPENVGIEQDLVRGKKQHVLVCKAQGDRYTGPVTGLWGKKMRVGGVIVSKQFFASGQFEVVMKIGSTKRHSGGPAHPTRPQGAVPAIWTYGYRYVEVGREKMRQFVPGTPLYNPLMEQYGNGSNEYWSELDFPEFGKNGRFDRAMYNTFCQNRHHSRLFKVGFAVDGKYHTYTTRWRTKLEPLRSVTDKQVVKHQGYWWIKDKTISFERYLGNPLKRLGKDRYAVHRGDRVVHWIDGKKVGENTKYVPVMAGQLNLGVWLPRWAGPAPWQTARVSFASVKVWQYDDPGDVRGVLTEDIKDNFDRAGRKLE